MNKTIGILGLQGNFYEHLRVLEKLKVKGIIIKYSYQLDTIDALIIPGGESTVMTKFIKGADNNLLDRLTKFIKIEKKPVMGTCAGAIILSKYILQDGIKVDGLIPAIDTIIERNSYGSQINSFMKEIKLKDIGYFNCIFIRAPKIMETNNCEILGNVDNSPVMIRSENVLLCTFHPELENEKVHSYFLQTYLK